MMKCEKTRIFPKLENPDRDRSRNPKYQMKTKLLTRNQRIPPSGSRALDLSQCVLVLVPMPATTNRIFPAEREVEEKVGGG